MTSTINAAVLAAAGEYLRVEEWPGARSNPSIEAMWEAAGMAAQKDDVPWCAAFVGAVLGQVGLRGTGKPNARSYLDWGRPVQIAEAQPGDICVFWRGSRSSWQGHVAFLVRFDGDSVVVRGGNQGDKVSDHPYRLTQLLGIRRHDVTTLAAVSKPRVLKLGDRGEEVRELQGDLARLRYFTGKIDGIFGPLTRGAVVAFQADHDLIADGEVGPLTRNAMAASPGRKLRDVDEKDLRARNSQTIAQGDKVVGVGGVGAGVSAIAVAAQGGEVVAALENASGLGERVAALVETWGPWIVLAAASVALVVWGRRIIAERVRAARTGENVSK